MDAIEICCKLQMVQNAARESLPLRRCQVDSQSGLLHLSKRIANSRIRLAPEKAAFTVVLTIGGHCFTDSVVPVWLQQNLHDVFERRPDSALYVECLIRLMSKRAKRGQAACQNPGLRINQRAVEVEKDGASRGHDLNITAERKRVHTRLV